MTSQSLVFVLGALILSACASQNATVADLSSPEDDRAICSTTHEHLDHSHGKKCGHKSVKHGDHLDYAHDGHLDCLHFGHYDVRPAT